MGGIYINELSPLLHGKERHSDTHIGVI